MNIEIWSDLICPWCYIGKRRFESALSQFENRDQVNVVWRSFELDPRAPSELNEKLIQMLSRKYGVSAEQARAMNTQVSEQAAQVGLRYQLENARPGNTFTAHRLVHFAATHNQDDVMVERLMRGYFCEALPIGEATSLVEAAISVGLGRDEVQEILASDRFANEVRADEQRAARFGIRGVPYFVFDERYGISGAQPTEVFLSALRQAANS